MSTKKVVQSASARQEQISREVDRNPYVLDHELAEMLNVSIHTIRADRKALGIPDVRKRFREIAEALSAKGLENHKTFGELLEAETDVGGISLLESTSDMAFSKGDIIRGDILFAQANTLASALVDSEHALTAQANVQFTAAAWVGEKILGKAKVIKNDHWKKEIEVILKTPRSVVFKGSFLVYALNSRIAHRLGLLRREESFGVHQ
ncbi:MAG TPA: hypothetical protein VLM37_06295 [Fibrobacteraceae bacterium]|nr:hypothetical protein [Fibrobacteraceae bacterium]